ncbi:hypothetical protein P9B03_00010 [Metasolibacillus meyeri]|uniref:Uncharacterized protein n=1 Tax=Metasolibacillus meyeri TaxID=1071052 RepID=A0AAW9NLQ2_9BACL|nr:hypothetical protein [Metasolibacillus meyeri]MEC1176870.1 hypothetical protein [Metasolibacillus meyeri]
MQHDADRFLMEHIFLKVLHMEHHESTLIDDTKQIKSNVWLVVEKGEISFIYAHKHYEISGFQIVHFTQHGQLTITSKHKASIYVIDYIGKVLYASSLLKILLEQAPMGQPLSFYPVAHTDVVLEIISNLYKHYKKTTEISDSSELSSANGTSSSRSRAERSVYRYIRASFGVYRATCA